MRAWLRTNRIYLIYFYFLVVIGTLFILTLGNPENKGNLNKVSDYSSGWESYVTNDNELHLIRVIDESLENKGLSFYTYNAYVTAKIDNKVFYEYNPKLFLTNTPGSGYRFLHIRDGVAGSNLEIIIKYQYPYMLTNNLSIKVGDDALLRLYYVRQELPDIVVNLIIFVLSCLLISLMIIDKKEKFLGRSVAYLAGVSLSFVIWTNVRLSVAELFVVDDLVRYYLYYLSVYVIPILVLGYINALYNLKGYDIIAWVHSIGCATLYILQIIGVVDFVVTLRVFIVFMLLEFLYVLYNIVQMYRKNVLTKQRFYVLFIAFSLVNINVIHWFFDIGRLENILLIRIGICMYLGLAVYDNLSKVFNNLVKAREVEFLKDIAYKDGLTGLNNRYAFDEAVKDIDLKTLSIVSFDINNLKYFNDFYGHIYGDRLISDAASILHELYDNIYRTGGDEFVALIEGATEQDLKRLRGRLRRLTEDYNMDDKNKPIVIEIACGFSMYRESDISYESILYRSDEQMYRHKKRMKEISRIKYERG